MKWAMALTGVVGVLVVVAFVVAVHGTDDDTPDALRACLRKTDAVIVHGEDGLGGLRRDLVLKTPPKVVPVHVADNAGVLLEGTGYRLLVIRSRKSPTLSGDVAMTVYHHADAYPVVAVETDDPSGMSGCVRAQR